MKNDSEIPPKTEAEESENRKSNAPTDPKEMKLTRKKLCEQWITNQNLLPSPAPMQINSSTDHPKTSCVFQFSKYYFLLMYFLFNFTVFLITERNAATDARQKNFRTDF